MFRKTAIFVCLRRIRLSNYDSLYNEIIAFENDVMLP